MPAQVDKNMNKAMDSVAKKEKKRRKMRLVGTKTKIDRQTTNKQTYKGSTNAR